MSRTRESTVVLVAQMLATEIEGVDWVNKGQRPFLIASAEDIVATVERAMKDYRWKKGRAA